MNKTQIHSKQRWKMKKSNKIFREVDESENLKRFRGNQMSKQSDCSNDDKIKVKNYQKGFDEIIKSH